jgi:hypothetical protein
VIRPCMAILPAALFCRFAKPGEHFSVEIFFARNSELIEVIVRREIFNAGKTRTLDPVLEPETSDETILCDTGNSRETHPSLKADPRFVDIHFHGSTFTHQLQKGTVELLVSGNFLPEEFLDRERRARMPNIPDHKLLPAPMTAQSGRFRSFSIPPEFSIHNLDLTSHLTSHTMDPRSVS